MRFAMPAILFCLFLPSCKEDEPSPNASSNLTQIGSMETRVNYIYWSCKMIQYDFDKYYPQLSKLYNDLVNKGCIDPDKNMNMMNVGNLPSLQDINPQFGHCHSVTLVGGEPALQDIATVQLMNKSVFTSKIDVCNSDVVYARDIDNHLTVLQDEWRLKSCTREGVAQEPGIILDVEACMSPCVLTNPTLLTCSTCSPFGSNVLAGGGNGVITCASEKDSRSAVQDYCKSHSLTNCNIDCKQVDLRNKVNGPLTQEAIDSPNNVVEGRVITKNYDDTNTLLFQAYATAEANAVPAAVGSINPPTVGNAVSPLVLVEGDLLGKATGRVGATLTLQVATSLSLVAQSPYVFVKNFASKDALGLPREEGASGVTYTCTLKTVEIKSMEGMTDLSIGGLITATALHEPKITNPDLASLLKSVKGYGNVKLTVNGKVVTGGAAIIKHDDATTDMFTSPLFRAAGKTLAEMKSQCTHWIGETIAVNSVIGRNLIAPLFLKSSKVKCTYKNKPQESYKMYNMSITENDDKSGQISYRDRVLYLFGSAPKTYVLSPKIMDKMAPELTKLREIGNTDSNEKEEILAKIMNEVVKPESSNNTEWPIDSCEVL